MIKDSAKELFEIVLVWKLDRFSRDRYDSAHYKHILKKNGVKVMFFDRLNIHRLIMPVDVLLHALSATSRNARPCTGSFCPVSERQSRQDRGRR